MAGPSGWVFFDGLTTLSNGGVVNMEISGLNGGDQLTWNVMYDPQSGPAYWPANTADSFLGAAMGGSSGGSARVPNDHQGLPRTNGTWKVLVPVGVQRRPSSQMYRWEAPSSSPNVSVIPAFTPPF